MNRVNHPQYGGVEIRRIVAYPVLKQIAEDEWRVVLQRDVCLETNSNFAMVSGQIGNRAPAALAVG